MRLYHSRLFLLLFLFILAGCGPVQAPVETLQIQLNTAEGQIALELPQGSTVEDAVEAAELTMGELDRTEPPLYTVLAEGSEVRFIRVDEEFDIEQVVIPYDSRTLRNEALPEGERRLVQAGVNGLQEITYRRVYEDNVEVSRNPVKTVLVQEPVPEIVMIGSQSPFAPVSIPGNIVYLAGGNAWLLDGQTGERRPVVTTADLDGRVFSLSEDSEWLLFTRAAGEDEENINSLWVANLQDPDLLVDLEVQNIVHFANWVPGAVLQIAYSTVEPRATAPGWQANNDLILVSFSPTGWVSDPEVLVEANAGGVYGWWGTTFAWAPNGEQLGFVRPDGLGVVNLPEGSLEKLLDTIPFQTFGDWAWVPGLSWSPEGNMLFSVDHIAQEDSENPENSPVFDITAVPLSQEGVINLISQAGMFAYPVPSPALELDSGETAYLVAYFQAIFPSQSETSKYQLVVMDRDGSNRQVLFPEPGLPGLEPQRLIWGPELRQGDETYDLAFIYQGNLWLVDVQSGSTRQLTGDSLISRIDWK